ncbi:MULTISPECIES: Atxe2 family lasso peptide isopeptidase [Sphingomonas]|jgi:dipeptidyl aminopeptidase/acylaminoacyl peptidase
MVMEAQTCLRTSLSAVLLGTLIAATPAVAKCEDIVPPEQVAMSRRDIVPLDLVRLRDIGTTADMMGNGSAIGISPDGTKLAVQLRRAEPTTNSYCHALIVIDLAKPSTPRVIDRGGDYIRYRFQRGPIAYYTAGDPLLIEPTWSPDGRHVAFLKRVSDHVQVWIAASDGSGSRQLTNAPVDVEAFDWVEGGQAVTFQARPKRIEALRELDSEGLTGFVYDKRWSPIARNKPSHREPTDTLIETISLDGRLRPATPVEQRSITEKQERPDGAYWLSTSASGAAWSSPRDRSRSYVDGALNIRFKSGEMIGCTADSCEGRFNGLSLSEDGKNLLFLRRTGWANSQDALYIWHPGKGLPRHLLTTRDRFLGCRWARQRIICTLEQSSRPRRIVSLDSATGSISEIFDPNPEFRHLRLGPVERLEWRNNRNVPVYADLVLPLSRKPGERVPLIIVQYRTREFLRGGTGDEYPIFALAAQGFAVLSFERPTQLSLMQPTKNHVERAKLDYGDWADRKSVMSAFASGIELLDRRGLIDPKRVGITGLSDGAVSAKYAMLNSRLFAAAALSGCCTEPKTHAPLLGQNGWDNLRTYLYPRYIDDAPAFWNTFSIARNAERFRTPLLVQASDDEYLAALETFTSLREAGGIMDLIVFPDEHHMKWQPAHRLAMYNRYIAWFSFWLKGDAGLYARPEDLERWRELRDRAGKAEPS